MKEKVTVHYSNSISSLKKIPITSTPKVDVTTATYFRGLNCDETARTKIPFLVGKKKEKKIEKKEGVKKVNYFLPYNTRSFRRITSVK